MIILKIPFVLILLIATHVHVSLYRGGKLILVSAITRDRQTLPANAHFLLINTTIHDLAFTKRFRFARKYTLRC